jgi:sulfite exporter TauE/SafE
VLGFFGSVHCLGMCGGIAAALGQAIPDRSATRGLARASLYSLGRITSYSIAGAGVGFAGEAFSTSTGLTIALRVLTGTLILAFGLHVAGWWNGLAAVERLGLTLWRRISPLARRIGPPDRIWKTFALGMLWGWLPCGLVYAALIAAAATGEVVRGAAFMACFGLGTLPALLAASGFGARLGRFLALRSARRAAGTLLLAFGIWSIAGALMPLQGGHGAHAGAHDDPPGPVPVHEAAHPAAAASPHAGHPH